MSQQVVQLEKLGDSSLTIEPEAADIRGRTVKERDGEEIGEVDDLFVDVQERRVRMMQVASGGFLGLGESKSIIPIDAITKITEDWVHVDLTRDRVAGAPAYDPELVTDDFWTQTYGYYGYPYYWGPGYIYPPYPYLP